MRSSRASVACSSPDPDGRTPWHGATDLFSTDPHWRGLHLFYEYFHGDTGAGLGASHQTGWTALVARLLEDVGHKCQAEGACPL